jgi:hypothetical protein
MKPAGWLIDPIGRQTRRATAVSWLIVHLRLISWLEHVVPSRFSLVQPHSHTNGGRRKPFFFFSLGS